MAMTPYSGDTSVIGKLGTTPQERGLTTQQFKDKFDEAFKKFIEGYFNTTHLDEIDAHMADNTNPHGVTAEQVGALKKNGDTMTGWLSLAQGCEIYPNFETETSWSRKIRFAYVDDELVRKAVDLEVDQNGTFMYTIPTVANYQIYHEGNNGRIHFGVGSPEGVVTAPVGVLYVRRDGGANTTLYVKESGYGNVGWIAK